MFEQESNEKVLVGTNVLVTRGVLQAEELSRKIIDLGGSVQEFPVIVIEPPKSYAELDQSLDQIQQYDWIVFASVNAVDYLLARYRERGLDEHLLEKCRIAAIGPATSNALTRHGLKAHFMPRSFIAEALVEEFQSSFDLTDKRLLWPRTTVGRQLIREELSAAGARVDMVTAYETGLPPESVSKAAELLDLLENRKFDVILMASSQSVKNFAKILEIALQKQQEQCSEVDGQPLSAVLGTAQILTIGPETSKTVQEYFGHHPLEARSFTIQGMIDRLIEYIEVGNKSCSAGGSETPADKLGKNLEV
jgi:uroporphyrinogen-III synthase